MHDDPFAHAHDPDEIRMASIAEGNNPNHDYYHYENIELKTVGIDIGSSTSHLMFSRIHLQRAGELHSSRYVVVERETLYRSPILLTPYTADYAINTDRLQAFLTESYAEAGFTPEDVDSGAIILTGEAVKRTNAHAIADLFADTAGKFVCASAGHNLESILAANGSGSVAASKNPAQTVLNVDIGGGTTKFALVTDGQIIETAAISVGGRLIATDAEGKLIRIEPTAHAVADLLGIDLKIGMVLSDKDRHGIADTLADCLMEIIQRNPRSELTTSLLVTPDLKSDAPVDSLVFSGGVAEYVYEREERDFGDLAIFLAGAVRQKMEEHALPAPVQPATERIRATVIGASQFTVQLSGNTLSISDVVAEKIRIAYARQDLIEGETQVALAFDWDGLPRYSQLRKIADGIIEACPNTVASGDPIVLVFTGDFAKLIGDALTKDIGLTNPVISIDTLYLQEFDYIDVGDMIYPARVVPVVVKSLVFPEVAGIGSEVVEQ
jgi:ethanolamine utilization protein EutA